MNGSTIACASAGIEPARSLTLPDRHTTVGHVHALAVSKEKPSRLHLGCVRRAALIVATQDIAFGLNRNFHFWSDWIHHSETGHFAGLFCNLLTQHFLRASLIARYSISTHREETARSRSQPGPRHRTGSPEWQCLPGT